MNKTLNTLLGAMLLAGSASAFAASSVDLTVTGTITPSACTPALANGGVVKYDKISAKDLNPDSHTSIERRVIQLTVNCDAATLMALESKDNRKGSASSGGSMVFGLGLVNGTEKLGSMLLLMMNPIADNVPVRPISSPDNGASWSGLAYLSTNRIVSVAENTTLAPLPVQVLTADILVVPSIAPTRDLTLTNEVSIDGSATLTMRYL